MLAPAALLVRLALMDFLPVDDPRMAATLAASERALDAGTGDLFYRYRFDDGLSGQEGAFAACTANLAHLLAEKGIRANAVLPGPIWTPLITATMLPDEIEGFGKQAPLKRPGQPAEVAPPYVLLASDQGSYMTGAMLAVAGGAIAI